ncbi:MAG TPA: SPFH domain-containing protein, partial [Casimicrobiaceae bacterium]|nr:SPFH domain-containing protein [Casimicrobiaceae bacterium]
MLLTLAALAAAGCALYAFPPLRTVERGEVGVRTNLLTGGVSEWRDGKVFAMPGLHEMRIYSLRDQTYRPEQVSLAQGAAPLQSVEGLSLGVDLTFRYALDPSRVAEMSKSLPDDVSGEIVQPAVQGVIYKVFARYTVREIFSTKRV